MTKRTRSTVLMAAILSLSPPALSHEAEKGPNGGAILDVEGHHIELVATPGALTFYLTDENVAPITSTGTKIKAIVQDGGKTTQLELSPEDPNKLTVKTAAPVGSGAKVVVTGTLPDGHKLQGRFVIP